MQVVAIKAIRMDRRTEDTVDPGKGSNMNLASEAEVWDLPKTNRDRDQVVLLSMVLPHQEELDCKRPIAHFIEESTIHIINFPIVIRANALVRSKCFQLDRTSALEWKVCMRKIAGAEIDNLQLVLPATTQ